MKSVSVITYIDPDGLKPSLSIVSIAGNYGAEEAFVSDNPHVKQWQRTSASDVNYAVFSAVASEIHNIEIR
jgi:hypothetical protein